MARPYQRAQDGLWVLAVAAPDGRRRYLYAHSRRDVLAKADEMRGGWAAGLDLAPRRLTVGRQLDDWLAARRGRVRSSTWISYEGIVRLHLARVARIPLVRLRPDDIRRLLDQLAADGLAPRTVGYALVVLRMALRSAVNDGLIARNVATAVTAPKVERQPPTILDATDLRRLNDDGDPLWVFLAGTGARLGEALGLRWSDLDLQRGIVRFSGSLRPQDRRLRGDARRLQRVEPKTAAGFRSVALAPFVITALERHREALAGQPVPVEGYVFTTPLGSPLDPRNVSRSWAGATARLGLPRLRIHDLRHSYASQLLAAGYGLEDVKRALGHESIAVTSDTYGHLVEGRSRELAAGLDRRLQGA